MTPATAAVIIAVILQAPEALRIIAADRKDKRAAVIKHAKEARQP